MVRAKFVTKSVGATQLSGDNVILMPFVERGNVHPVQTSFLANADVDHTPPWLIEDRPALAAKPAPKKRAAAKKVAPKKPTAKKKKPLAKTKVKIKSASKPRVSKKPVSLDVAILEPKTGVTSAAPAIVAPLNRSQAPVVWQKNGPLHIMRFWLRTARTRMLSALTPAPKSPVNYSEPKLRTRKALLLELATLRQENATLRKKLGLPEMPFGRQVADRM